MNINDFINWSIPNNISLEGWESVEIKECNEELIKINDIFPKIICNSEYWARKTVVNMLIKAATLLPVDCKFLVRDGYRSYETQKNFFDNYYNILKTQFPNLEETELIKLTSQKVAIPSKNMEAPSPHSTGASIDINIYKDDEKVNMGGIEREYTKSDETAYFENKIVQDDFSIDDIHIVINRRLLYNIMINVGFVNNPEEFWHYSYGDQKWAVKTSNKAIYGYIDKNYNCIN